MSCNGNITSPPNLPTNIRFKCQGFVAYDITLTYMEETQDFELKVNGSPSGVIGLVFDGGVSTEYDDGVSNVSISGSTLNFTYKSNNLPYPLHYQIDFGYGTAVITQASVSKGSVGMPVNHAIEKFNTSNSNFRNWIIFFIILLILIILIYVYKNKSF